MRRGGLFVTGTDTGVGKTMVSAMLLRVLRRAGIDATPMKPVQTGCIRTAGALLAPDLEFCLRAASLAPAAAERVSMSPYCFEPACSPHLAARKAGASISIDHVKSCYDELRKQHDFVIVEGAGGVLVPLDSSHTMLDLMVTLDLPVVVVARAGLGTINHTLLTLSELKRAGVAVAGVVLNEAFGVVWGEIEADNVDVIRRRGRVPVLGRLPFLGSIESEKDPGAILDAHAADMPSADALMARIAEEPCS